MNDRSHLVRTVITDRRGRKTTVYRRPAAGSRLTAQVPTPSVADHGRSSKDRLTGILRRITPDRRLSEKGRHFLSMCTDEQARVIAVAHETHPGFADILTAETTSHPSYGFDGPANPTMTAAIARVYEEGAVDVSAFSAAPYRAHAFHQLYSIAVTTAHIAANRAGVPAASPLDSGFDAKHLDAARECVRVWSVLGAGAGPRSGINVTGSEDILDAVVSGHCTAAAVDEAIHKRGATESRQIIALATGIAAPVSDGWL